MKKWFLWVWIIFAGFCPFVADAYWQIADPAPNNTSEDVGAKNTNYPARYESQPAFTLQLEKGSLLTNVTNFAVAQGWQVKWRAKTKYPQLMTTTITGPNFPAVMQQLLSHYPLKARYNINERVMTVWASNK